ncbi:hypothetical protein ABZ078_36255 [Streptomyces sp. NPDC006385]|uniref:hypothetical protein n=1 Tax=Streptomyces sp. NPDC006385 TaxID=3156761 RepID=UPI0033B0BFC1
MSLTRVVLTSGRSLDLSELRLCSTYGGMLEGYPCKPINDMTIKGLVRTAERAHPSAPVHLVPPPREYPDQYAGAFGPVEVLPAVACVGAFHSTALDSHGTSRNASSASQPDGTCGVGWNQMIVRAER